MENIFFKCSCHLSQRSAFNLPSNQPVYRLLSVLLLFIVSVAVMGGCRKSLTEEIYLDTLITDNDAPPYDGVSEVQVSNYINKLFIDLIGREPTAQELSEIKTFLAANELDFASRDSVAEKLLGSDDYFLRLAAITSADFINAVDSSGIAYEIALIEFVWELDSINGNFQNYIYYQAELNKLFALQSAAADYAAALIGVNEFFARYLNNYFYDQVNMGSENFVKGSFDDLFRRSPTDAELQNGVAMVDNASSILFLQSGNSKGQYIGIVTTCDEFYEGLVKKSFQQLLLREPGSQEIASGISAIKQNNDWQAYIKSIVKTDEYAGF
jgi:hypothetical protein